MRRKVREPPRIVSFPFHGPILEVVAATFRFRDRFKESTDVRVGKQGLVFSQTRRMFLRNPNRFRFAALSWCGCSARSPDQRSAGRRYHGVARHIASCYT
jgi:hypothetical protein